MYDPDLIDIEPERTARIVQFQRRAGLHRQFNAGNTTGSLSGDFFAMWPVPSYLRHVDWYRVIRGVAALIGFFALGKAIVSLL